MASLTAKETVEKLTIKEKALFTVLGCGVGWVTCDLLFMEVPLIIHDTILAPDSIQPRHRRRRGG